MRSASTGTSAGNGSSTGPSQLHRANSHAYQDHLPLHSHANHTYVVRSTSNQRDGTSEEGAEEATEGYYDREDGDLDDIEEEDLPVVDIDLRY